MAATDSDGKRPVVLVSAARASEVVFSTHGLIWKGYNEAEVDDFLDEVVATLEYYEHLIFKKNLLSDE